MTETLLPQLQDPESRKAVIEVVLAMLNRWGINEVNQAELLGVAKLSDLQASELPSGNTLVFERIGHLLAIDRALAKRYPEQPVRHDRWVIEPQTQLDDQMPLAIMLEQGIEGIKHIRHILES